MPWISNSTSYIACSLGGSFPNWWAARQRCKNEVNDQSGPSWRSLLIELCRVRFLRIDDVSGAQCRNRSEGQLGGPFCRILYVTCTRAGESLALVIYSDDPNAVAATMIGKEWVSEDEVLVS